MSSLYRVFSWISSIFKPSLAMTRNASTEIPIFTRDASWSTTSSPLGRRNKERMGRLVGLELHNFKSYKGTVKVGFGDSNFTSIIGPNGSGKSNMMDAISFVLGVRSRHLRSNVLKDLIYRGVASEDTEDVEADEADNPTTAYVKAFYLKGDSTVELSRYISKGGDTTYRMNGKAVDYKRYASFLEDENILIRAKNFLVFQGDVVQIASQSAMELTNFFEEFSGSIQYKKEYDILKEKVQTLGQSTAESIKNRRRVHAEMRTYKEGINKNEEFEKQINNKLDLQNNYALWQLYHLQQEKIENNEKLNDCKSKIRVLKDKIASEEKKLAKLRASFAEDSALIIKQKSSLSYKIKEKEDIESQLLPVKLSQRAALKRIGNFEKRIDSLKRDVERQQSYVERFENQLKVVTKTKENFEAEAQKSIQDSSKYHLNEDDLKLYSTLNEKYLNSGGFTIEGKISNCQNDKNDIIDDIELIRKRKEISKSRIADELLVSKQTLELQISDLSSSLNEKNQTHSEQASELKKLQSEIESSNNKEYDLNYKLREALIKIDDLSASQRETFKERRLRENVATLKKFFPGIRGLVSDLCQPKRERYALAVSTILGRNFDSIMVDNAAIAQECIAYLKKQRAGIASFIPLDTIEVETPTLPVSESLGCILSINAIEFEPEYERAMQYVCSDSIICNTLEIAKDLKWKKNIKSKLVTLEGALIHRAGLMTGGISKDGSNRWDKEEYQSLMTLKDKLLLQIEEVGSHSRACSIRARELEESISVIYSEASGIRTQISQLKRSLEDNNVDIEYHQGLITREYDPKIAELEQKLASVNASLKNLEEEKEQLQAQAFKELTDRLGYSMKEYETHSGEARRQQSKELQQLQKQILNVENKLEFEKERLTSTSNRLSKSQADLEKVKDELQSLQEQEEDICAQTKKVENSILEAKSKVEQLEQKLKNKQRSLNLNDEQLTEQNSSMQSMKRERDEIKDLLEKGDLERICVLKNCKISNMQIPIVSDIDLQALPIDRIDGEAIRISNEIEIDYDSLPAKYKEGSEEAVEKSFEKDLKQVDEILSVLQPNAKATDRFNEAQEKFGSINDETEQLKKNEKKVLAQFIKIKRKRKSLFEKAFEYVTEHIDPIYRELTKNPNSTSELAGGSASLTLEDEDEPFNAGIRYHATPPLKRFKDMEYLSGGEKTVAALALLFTINSYQPSPFFVLDEVDAALDTTNVERVATYIRRHGNPDLQFIVISLKNTMFEKSDALVGVYRQQELNTSKVVTLNLRNYAN